MKKEEFIQKSILNYPDHYHDFSDGLCLTDSEIKKMIEECINSCVRKMSTGLLREAFSTSSTGDTKVIVECYLEGKDDLMTFFVSVCKNYKQKIVVNVEL